MNHKVWFSDKIKTIEDKPCVIEFQAFRGNKDEYVVKELVILDLLTYVVYHFMFKPPHAFKKLKSKAKVTNKWLTRNFHHITWDEGFIDYCNVDDVMYHFCSTFNLVYTKGSEKRNWIQKYATTNVFDVTKDDRFIASYTNINYDNICLASKSKNHREGQCALKNVYSLASFLSQEEEENDSSGGNGWYKKGGGVQTAHHYYSELGKGNTLNCKNDITPEFS